jgi:hypothetical protein
VVSGARRTLVFREDGVEQLQRSVLFLRRKIAEHWGERPD